MLIVLQSATDISVFFEVHNGRKICPNSAVKHAVKCC